MPYDPGYGLHVHVHVYIQFYIAESSLEVLARHMMFLALISEPLDKLGLQGELYIRFHIIM